MMRLGYDTNRPILMMIRWHKVTNLDGINNPHAKRMYTVGWWVNNEPNLNYMDIAQTINQGKPENIVRIYNIEVDSIDELDYLHHVNNQAELMPKVST